MSEQKTDFRLRRISGDMWRVSRHEIKGGIVIRQSDIDVTTERLAWAAMELCA